MNRRLPGRETLESDPANADDGVVARTSWPTSATRWVGTGAGAGMLSGAVLLVAGHDTTLAPVLGGVVTFAFGCRATLTWIRGRVARQRLVAQNAQARKNIAAITAIPQEFLSRGDRTRLYFQAMESMHARQSPPTARTTS